MDFIFNRFIYKNVLYLFLSTSIAWIYSYYYLPQSQNIWLLWVVFLSALNFDEISFVQRLKGILFADLGVILVVCLAFPISTSLPLLSIYLFLVIILGFFCMRRYPAYFFPVFMIVLFTVLAVSLPVSLNDLLNRLTAITDGFLIVFLCQFIFLYRFKENEWQFWLFKSIQQLSLLTQEIFSCFLNPEYQEHYYLFERRIHLKKNALMTCMLNLWSSKVQNKIQLESLDTIFNLTLSCGQLRKRISDHTTFSLCQEELTEILKAFSNEYLVIMKILNLKKKKKNPQNPNLREGIKKLEDNYMQVLQVTAREPLAFSLFIANLKKLQQQIAAFEGLVNGP